jgi:hypothetical protein
MILHCTTERQTDVALRSTQILHSEEFNPIKVSFNDGRGAPGDLDGVRF